MVRRAALAEADLVGALTERAYRHGGWGGDEYAKVLLDGRSRIEEAVVFVAAVAGEVIGTVTIAPPGSRFGNVNRADEAEVRMLAVDPGARGQGAGNALLTAGEASAWEMGLAAVVLSTEPDMHAAHRLYRRRGYVREPSRDWRINGTELLVFRLLR